MLELRLGRWRCLNERCNRKTFVERLPSVAAPMARRTVRVAEIVKLFGHAAGGLPSERLLARLCVPLRPRYVADGKEDRGFRQGCA